MFNQWCTIESDPGVFTQLIRKVGCPSVQVEQIYSMEDDEIINNIKPQIYGFIFLFKWTKQTQKRQALEVYDNDLYFARQIVNNACATQAIISILLNAPIKIEGTLKQFYQFTKDMPSQDRGLSLSNSSEIRIIHNSFSRPQPFVFKQDKKRKKKESDIYHFVSYVPHKGKLYQLDGLQPGPILLGTYTTTQQWIQLAKQQITHRINKYSEKEIRFNLLLVCEDLQMKAKKQIQQLQKKKTSLKKKLYKLDQSYQQSDIDKFPQVQEAQQNDPNKLHQLLSQQELKISHHQAFSHDQQQRFKQRHEQNIRRKHNYIPLILNALKLLSKNGKLGSLIEKATKKPQ